MKTLKQFLGFSIIYFTAMTIFIGSQNKVDTKPSVELKFNLLSEVR